MASPKKKVGIVAVIVGALIALPRPAHALKLPGPLNTLVDIVTARIGLGLGEKLNGYIELGLGKLDKMLGLDPNSISGSLGIIDPLEAAQAIDNKAELDGDLSDLDINPVSDGKIQKGRFTVEYGRAISASILSKAGQSALNESSEATQKLTEGSAELAQQAQSKKVTQDIAKIQTQQNAQTISVLNAVSQKQDLELQQQAATTANTSVAAEHANNEEARAAQESANNAAYSTQQAGLADGVIEGIGK